MQSNESPAPLLPSIDVGGGVSPLHPRNLFNLLFRPRRFFEQLHTFQHTPYLYLCAWLYGVMGAIDRIDQFILEAEASGSVGIWAQLASSWVFYWLFCLVFGALSGLLIWWVGGWWYGKRIRASGERNPDGFVVRQIYFYSGVVVAIPTILLTLFSTFIDFDEEMPLPFVILYMLLMFVLPFWSVMIGYIGVRTRFRTVKWVAVLLIIGLPLVMYAFDIIMLVVSLVEDV